MLENIPSDSLVVVKDDVKKTFLKSLRRDFGLKNVTVIGLKEFKKKFYFDYTNEAVFYLSKKYGIIKSVAEIYLKNLYYVDGKVENEKILFLKNIKDDLKNESLLIETPLFKDFLKTKKVVLYNLRYIDKFYENMFAEVERLTKVTRLDETKKITSKKDIYAFLDIDSELEFVATEISKLLKSGILINNIKIANVKEDYIFKLKNIFKDFHIPIEIPSEETIASTKFVQLFKDYYKEDSDTVIEKLKTHIHNKREEDLLKSIVETINSYSWATDRKEIYPFLLEDIENIKVREVKLKDKVSVVDFLTEQFEREDHIFLINFNQGSFPNTKKDEDYLSDDIKRKLGISDSVDLNKKIFQEAEDKIASTEHLVITYSKKSNKGELYVSPIYKEELLEPKTPHRSFEHSDSHNLKELLKERDERQKYDVTTEDLKILEKHYREVPYMSYDNKWKGIKKEKLMGHLNDKLVLSYSSMNTYYQCSFRYYLDNILKMDEFRETFETTVGSVFHRVLSFAFKENFDFETSWSKTLEESTYEFDKKEKFFLSLLKSELEFIIDSIYKGMEYTDLKSALYEQKITVEIDPTTTFKGFVDKIIYGEIDGKKIAAIIDYKTGTPELKLDNIYYGLDMQLPVYAYLIGKYEPLKDAKIGGFYLQKILSNKKTESDKLAALKLQGYSTSDIETLKHVDKNYEDSRIIKSLKTGKNGFYSYAKVLTDEQIKKITDIVEQKIEEAAKNIKEAKFDIDPKQIGMFEVGCKFCNYRDICYKNAIDVKKVPYMKAEDFLGGDSNADVD